MANREAADYDLLLRDLAVELIRPRYTRPRSRRARRAAKPHQVPRLLFVHFLLPDSWLHRYGTSRLHERWSLELTDNAIGRIVRAYRRQKIWNQTTAFVVSDHGFAEITHTMDLRRLLVAKGFSKYRRLDARRAKEETFASVLNGHAALLYPRSDKQRKRLPELVKLLRGYPRCIKSVLAPAAYRRIGLPVPPAAADGKETRPDEQGGAPALIALSRPDCIFRGRSRRAPLIYKLKHGLIGYHGYLPRYGKLRAVLIASGAGIRKLERPLSAASLTDIAPTLAHLLGLRWPERFPAHPDKPFTLDGRILKDALK